MASAIEVVDAINTAWRTGRVDDLAAHFDPAAVIVGPGFQPLARGAEACVASYRDFLRVSIVHDYRQSALAVHESDDVAVVTFGWEMEYEQGGRRSRESGTDLFVLRRHGDGWLAVWRAVTLAPATDPAG
jgi:ketosteroid isomerase-like protein